MGRHVLRGYLATRRLTVIELHEFVASDGPLLRAWRNPVGHASVKFADAGAGRLGRILIDPTRRGHGLGDALVGAVLSDAYDKLELARIDLGVFTHNVAALRLYHRHGFTSRALLPSVERINGATWDALQMSLTRARYYSAA